MTELRAKTGEEIRDEFFDHIFDVIDQMAGDERLSAREKIYLFAFHMMNIFDGSACDLSFGLLLVPTCHSGDPDHHRGEGNNWYPVNEEASKLMESELSGGDTLHDAFCNHPRAHPERDGDDKLQALLRRMESVHPSDLAPSLVDLRSAWLKAGKPGLKKP